MTRPIELNINIDLGIDFTQAASYLPGTLFLMHQWYNLTSLYVMSLLNEGYPKNSMQKTKKYLRIHNLINFQPLKATEDSTFVSVRSTHPSSFENINKMILKQDYNQKGTHYSGIYH